MIGNNHFGKASSFLKNLILTLKSKVGHLRIVNKVKKTQTFTNK
jgi:hypothetical protein